MEHESNTNTDSRRTMDSQKRKRIKKEQWTRTRNTKYAEQRIRVRLPFQHTDTHKMCGPQTRHQFSSYLEHRTQIRQQQTNNKTTADKQHTTNEIIDKTTHKSMKDNHRIRQMPQIINWLNVETEEEKLFNRIPASSL
eukprot:Lankesteria_metandrocarpae@DN10718_c0_g1_i1.p1